MMNGSKYSTANLYVFFDIFNDIIGSEGSECLLMLIICTKS